MNDEGTNVETPTTGDAGPTLAGDAPGEAAAWRSRAVAAEGHLRDLEAKLVECEKNLAATREALDAAERRRRIERELVEADAIDLESALLLTEAAVASMPDRDVALAVRDLRRRKPFLFRGGSARAPAMAGATRGGGGDLGHAAEAARVNGDRESLLRYLRMKRVG